MVPFEFVAACGSEARRGPYAEWIATGRASLQAQFRDSCALTRFQKPLSEEFLRTAGSTSEHRVVQWEDHRIGEFLLMPDRASSGGAFHHRCGSVWIRGRILSPLFPAGRQGGLGRL